MKKLTPTMFKKALKLLRRFMKQAKQYLKDKERIKHLLTAALTLAEARRGKLWEGIRLLVRLLRAWMNGSYEEVSTQTLIAIVAAILYLVSPLDLIPDFIPGVGYVDDGAVIAWLFKSIHDELLKFKAWEEGP